MIIANTTFNNNKTYVMGILNVTPDSFSDGGEHNSLDKALFYAEKMINDGVDIIDIGGESTRPGYSKISDNEELLRILPVIEGIHKRFDVPISVDTYKSDVAECAIKAGAHFINDIWGLKYDSKMAEVIKKYRVPCCIMHNRSNTEYVSLVDDVIQDLRESIAIADRAGIESDMIVIDPGIGFAKTYEQNLLITKNLEKLHTLGLPILFGASRKSMIGQALNLPVTERLEGTLATTAVAVMKGCMFVRVHDVLENKRVITMTERILYGTN